MIIHPCLYATPDQLEVARHNIARHEWAQRTYQELKLSADKLRAMELPTFETAWWQEARKKDWRNIYPENMRHTYFVPRPATDLAFQSALVYALGGGSIYAERAKKVLLHYTSYSFEVEHPDVGMNYSVWGINLLWTYDIIYDRLTPEEREKVDDFFKRMVEAVARSDEWWIEHNPGGRYNNHYAWHKLMMAAYGLLYEKPEWVERAVESDQGIRDLMEHGFLDDGLWFESSLNYHFAAFHALINAAQMFRNAEYPLDLYTHQFAKGRTLEDGFSGMVLAAFPDTSIPTIGDCYGGTVRLRDVAAYETAWNVYRRPLYAWLISQNPRPGVAALFREGKAPAERCNCHPEQSEGSLRRQGDSSASPQNDMCQPAREDPRPPAVKSRVFPEHGHVILRSVEGKEYWNSDSWAAFLSFDLNSVHAHADKMDLILFGRGKVLAPDPETRASAQHAFSSQVQRELNRSTVCHNTLMVDGKGHAGIGEKLSLLEFKRSPKVKSATIADLKGLVYPGVKLQRTVVVTDACVLDVFQTASDTEHTYEWLFHAVDDKGETLLGVGDGETVRWGDPSASIAWRELPWSWLRNPRSKAIDDTWQAEWRQGEVRFRLTMLGVPGTEVTLCDFPRNDKFEPPAIPMLIVRRTGKSATFIAVYQAEKGDLPAVTLSAAGDERRKLSIRVTVGGVATERAIEVLR